MSLVRCSCAVHFKECSALSVVRGVLQGVLLNCGAIL